VIRYLGLAFLAWCILVFATGCVGEGGGGERTTVPNVVDLAFRDAQTRLASRGLRWRQRGTEYVFDQPPSGWSTADDDVVVSQDPPPGARVEPASVVTLEIACHPPGDESGRCID